MNMPINQFQAGVLVYERALDRQLVLVPLDNTTPFASVTYTNKVRHLPHKRVQRRVIVEFLQEANQQQFGLRRALWMSKDQEKLMALLDYMNAHY